MRAMAAFEQQIIHKEWLREARLPPGVFSIEIRL